MNQTAIGWIALAIAVIVYLDLLFVELRRVFREGMRIVKRLMAYGDLPVIAQAARAGDDAARLAAALEAVPALLERGRRAIAIIRHPRTADRDGYPFFVPNGSDASNGLSPD